jgi:hypothetical protein
LVAPAKLSDAKCRIRAHRASEVFGAIPTDTIPAPRGGTRGSVPTSPARRRSAAGGWEGGDGGPRQGALMPCEPFGGRSRLAGPGFIASIGHSMRTRPLFRSSRAQCTWYLCRARVTGPSGAARLVRRWIFGVESACSLRRHAECCARHRTPRRRKTGCPGVPKSLSSGDRSRHGLPCFHALSPRRDVPGGGRERSGRNMTCPSALVLACSVLVSRGSRWH